MNSGYFNDISETIFREYDIRGIYNKDITPEIAERIGRAYSLYLGSGSSVCIGRDLRPSSEPLYKSLIKGFLDQGCNVIDLGKVPTPLLYFGTHYLKANGGIMVTASHLPLEWNGFKFCNDQGHIISNGIGLEKIKKNFIDDNYKSNNQGILRVYSNILDDYIGFIKSIIKINRMLKVVVDYGNSVSALAIPKIFDIMGFNVINRIEINKDTNIEHPNRSLEPTESALGMLKKTVILNNADIGLAFDGDGDRVVFVDNKGRYLNTGNIAIPIFSKYYLKEGYMNNYQKKIVFDLTCSSSVEEYVCTLGGEPIVTKVGHSYLISEMIKEKAIFGGQYSGHLSFAETGYRDDAIFGSFKMLEIISNSTSTLSNIVESLPKYCSSEMVEIPCDDSKKFDVINNIFTKIRYNKDPEINVISIDGIKIVKKRGWVLIRASNTSPIIRVIADAKDCKEAEDMKNLGIKIVREVINDN
ncbi:MAG: phosphomannomutase/phosphoglucomutase [Thermoplasmata archaeon]